MIEALIFNKDLYLQKSLQTQLLKIGLSPLYLKNNYVTKINFVIMPHPEADFLFSSTFHEISENNT